MKLKRVMLIILAILFLLAALQFTLYPLISNYVNDKYQSEVRTSYEEEVRDLDDAALREARAAAEAYNASLAPVQFDREGVIAAEDYYELLDVSGSGIMGYVEIEKLGLQLPIYHGTSEATLEEGVGHLVGSSLPIGGKGTHAVLTGHSGVAGKKLFSDLDQLRAGDQFLLRVLGETLAYRVTEINIVVPEETELLELVPGEDLCTLITCYPFGVNTHRLLVRGSRVPYAPKTESLGAPTPQAEEPAKSTWEEHYVTSLWIGGGIVLGAAFLGLIILWIRKKRGKKEQEAAHETES